MQGFTERIWRECHKEIYSPEYGAADEYCAPFARIERGAIRTKDLHDISTADTAQVIFRNTTEFDTLVAALHRQGVKRISLNMGCPFPMQMKKGRGAAILVNQENILSDISNIMAKRSDIIWSVKMRLGRDNPEEWKLAIDAINEMPLEYVAMHPRTANVGYKGDINIKEFHKFCKECNHPIVYNGDITSVDDLTKWTADKSLYGIMIARGLMMRPSLIAEWRSGSEWTHAKRVRYINKLHEKLFAYYKATLYGDTQILMKIRPFWEYLEQEIGHNIIKLLKKATSLRKYEPIAEAIIHNTNKT